TRQAAPDPQWGDRLRRTGIWKDRQALAELLRDAPVDQLSPQLLTLVSDLLRNHPFQEAWLRKAQARYPADFWLELALGNATFKGSPQEAAGFFWAALAVRPRSAAVYNNLG